MKCPGQDSRNWKPEDVFEVSCPACGASVELFRTDTVRRCYKCAFRFKNPRLDLSCAQWCAFATQCLGKIGGLSRGTQLSPVPEVPDGCPLSIE